MGCLMHEVDNYRYYRCNHGHDTYPETTHAKYAIVDICFLLLALRLRLVGQCIAAFRLGAPYRFNFSVRELEPSAELPPPMARNIGAAEQ